jgi:hypothetical protein
MTRRHGRSVEADGIAHGADPGSDFIRRDGPASNVTVTCIGMRHYLAGALEPGQPAHHGVLAPAARHPVTQRDCFHHGKARSLSSISSQ